MEIRVRFSGEESYFSLPSLAKEISGRWQNSLGLEIHLGVWGQAQAANKGQMFCVIRFMDHSQSGVASWHQDTGIHEPPRTNALVFENQMIKGPVQIFIFPLIIGNKCKKSSTIL